MCTLYIKERRLLKQMSQAALAEAVNVNQTAVSQWERQAALPSCEKLPDLASALSCEIGDLFRPPSSIVPENEV